MNFCVLFFVTFKKVYSSLLRMIIVKKNQNTPCLAEVLMLSIVLTVKVRVYSLNDDLKPAKRETVLTYIVSMVFI